LDYKLSRPIVMLIFSFFLVRVNGSSYGRWICEGVFLFICVCMFRFIFIFYIYMLMLDSRWEPHGGGPRGVGERLLPFSVRLG
jgi:hypothetical protein